MFGIIHSLTPFLLAWCPYDHCIYQQLRLIVAMKFENYGKNIITCRFRTPSMKVSNYSIRRFLKKSKLILGCGLFLTNLAGGFNQCKFKLSLDVYSFHFMLLKKLSFCYKFTKCLIM